MTYLVVFLAVFFSFASSFTFSSALSGFIVGKNITSRIDSRPKSTSAMRSIPQPIPPVGGRPVSGNTPIVSETINSVKGIMENVYPELTALRTAEYSMRSMPSK